MHRRWNRCSIRAECALPTLLPGAKRRAEWHAPKRNSPSWCFPARRRCRSLRRRRRDFSPGAASPSISSRRRIPRSSARAWPRAATRSCTAPPTRRWRWSRPPRSMPSIVAGGDNGFNHLFVQPGDRAPRRSARPDAGRRRRQHRLVVRAVRNPAAARPRARRLRDPRGRRAVPPLRGDARRQDDGGGDPQSAVRHPRAARRAEGHGRRGRHHRALSRHGALRAARLGQGQRRHAGRLSRRLASRACAGRSIRRTRPRR